MFSASMISLSDGQSYSMVKILEDADIQERSLPKPFEEWTVVFMANNKYIISHHWQIALIKIFDFEILAGSDSLLVDRLILSSDVIYESVRIINRDNWASKGIPPYCDKIGGITSQLSFTCKDGTFITYDNNCTSMLLQQASGSIKTQNINHQNLMKYSIVNKIERPE